MMELLGDGVMWKLVSVRLEMVLVSVQDRVHGLCQMCHRLRNHFGHTPMVLLHNEAQVEPCLGTLGDIADADRCTVCTKRTIGLKIVLDEPNATPR